MTLGSTPGAQARTLHRVPEPHRVPIAYPHAIYDEDSGQWISDAEIAETTYTAYPSRRKSEQITVRLIVRRVKDKNAAPSQGELFTAWRYHAFITDSALQLVAAEKQHREHAIIEQVNADLKDSALAHMPSGSFSANAAWLALAAIAHNLTRAAGCLASLFHATAHRNATPPPDYRARPHRPAIPPHHAPPAAALATSRCLRFPP